MKSDLFIECAKSVVDFYNLTQESIGSKNRMEYPVVKEVKPREWWVRILDENHIEITKNEIELAGWSFDRLSKIIKVREVIQ